jgi:hypothetical protein
MKIGKWTIIAVDKRIIKQYENAIGYEILDNNFWLNNLNQNIKAIQYTNDSNDFDQVEYKDNTPNSIFSGDIKIFSDKWDEVHLLNLQNSWDSSNIEITLEDNTKRAETIEEKINRLGPRPTTYKSEDIY